MHMCVCAFTCVCVRVCARAFVCVCVLVVLIPAVLCMSAGHKLSATQCVEGMASGLYEELFTTVVSLINRYTHTYSIHIHTHTHTHAHTHTHTQPHSHIHTHTQAHSHIYTHTHTQTVGPNIKGRS